MIVALESGKVDGYISEKPGTVSVKVSNPDLTYIEFSEGNGFEALPEALQSAIAVKKGSPLLADINKALETITEEQRQKIMETLVSNQPVSQN